MSTFSAIPLRGKATFWWSDYDNVRFVLEQCVEMDFYSARTLAQRPRIDMSLQFNTLYWFWSNQSLLFLLNDACLAEKHEMPILYFLVWPYRLSNPQSTALEEITLTITPPMRLPGWNISIILYFNYYMILSFPNL